MNSSTRLTATLEPWESIEALQHFVELVSFIERYLSKKLSLYRDLRAGSGTQIAFEDLWMLYEHKDSVVCPIRKGGQFLFPAIGDEKPYFLNSNEILVPQLYRVLACSGGTPLWGSLTKTTNRIKSEKETVEDGILDLIKYGVSKLRDQTEDQEQAENQTMKQRYSPLYIFCLSLNFNPAKLHIATEAFVLRPYERSVDITSLEIYPSRFKSSKKSDLNFLSRARRGMQTMNICHLQYKGLTLGENYEDVSSRPELSIVV